MALIFDTKIKDSDLDNKVSGADEKTDTSSTDTATEETTDTSTTTEDYSTGDLKIDNSGAYYTPDTLSEENTVQGRLAGLLASESPYITAAKASATQAANQRGLINSTMAATAGEKAAIESALPIAQQDASYYQEKALGESQGSIQDQLYQTQGEISSELSAQEYNQEAALQEAEIAWNKIELAAQQEIELAQLEATQQEIFNNTINAISEDYMNDYLAILTDKTLKKASDRQVALNALYENTKQRYELAASIAGVELDWEL